MTTDILISLLKRKLVLILLFRLVLPLGMRGVFPEFPLRGRFVVLISVQHLSLGWRGARRDGFPDDDEDSRTYVQSWTNELRTRK